MKQLQSMKTRTRGLLKRDQRLIAIGPIVSIDNVNASERCAVKISTGCGVAGMGLTNMSLVIPVLVGVIVGFIIGLSSWGFPRIFGISYFTGRLMSFFYAPSEFIWYQSSFCSLVFD
ncbi:hypothetical protein K1719_013421 [Acacia pycnantha]|nr:hypothetical protein K1719_013421 [Acacia pycnantha]